MHKSHVFWGSLEPSIGQHEMYSVLSINTFQIKTFIATML